ncbi:unnamed protein product [Brassica oleracea var. botrytis]|uniref:Uncharacterized protein n=1 Tax=Brassica oleracea TaxID=3712 RepID=A0A3P6ATD5_BRAOL|nr:unnamed protein product [Brassica oleracea]
MLPFFDIEVVTFERRLDYFSFTQDDRLKVHIVDGIKYIRDITNS